MNLSISKDANQNYLAKSVQIREEDWRPHSNADRLKCVTIDFQNVITGIDAPAGHYVYFPVECQIADVILRNTNSYRDASKNANPEKSGFFEDNRRVKAIRLRGERSQGYIIPFSDLLHAFGYDSSLQVGTDEYFDTVDGVVVCNKYVIPSKSQGITNKGKQAKKLTRLVEGQVHLHEDTDNLRKEIQRLDLDSTVTISYKEHGTSGWCSNVLVYRYMKWYHKLFYKLTKFKKPMKYDLVYGSRKVVKNRHFDPKGSDHFYSYDIWQDIVKKYRLDEIVPKGYSLYYEIVGFTKDGQYIQKPFDYGCNQQEGEAKIKVYRVTFTNADGVVYNLNTLEARNFTQRLGLDFVDVLYNGRLGDLLYFLDGEPTPDDEREHKEKLIQVMEKHYNNKDCYMCVNKVPEEGVVMTIEDSPFEFDAYKLKSSDFLEYESNSLNEQETGNE